MFFASLFVFVSMKSNYPEIIIEELSDWGLKLKNALLSMWSRYLVGKSEVKNGEK